jgi:hypothetical protein
VYLMLSGTHIETEPSRVSHVGYWYLYGNQLPIPVLLGRTLTLTHTYYMVILVFLNLYW